MNIWIIYVGSGILLSLTIYNRVYLMYVFSKIEAYYSLYKKKYSSRKPKVLFDFYDEKMIIQTKIEKTTSEPIKNISLISVGNDNPDFKISKIKFMLFEVKINNKTHTIHLHNHSDNYNFYIIGNVFNSNFVVWYLKEFMNLSIEINEIDKIHIMDHKYKLIVLDNSSNIILKEFNYDIKSDSFQNENIFMNKAKIN